ncbi:16665_t:CDS:1, partial [Funneliformis geosporum]
DPQSLPKKQNTFVAYTGYTFHEESQCARLPVATQWLFYGNLIDIDLPQLIQTNYFTLVNSERLYLLKRNIKTVSDQATQRYLDMRP